MPVKPCPGLRVKMSKALKKKILNKCYIKALSVVTHRGPFISGECFGCFAAHVIEFGDCIGILHGPVDFNNVKPGHPAYDINKIGPEWDVRWQPSNLRYAYSPADLERA